MSSHPLRALVLLAAFGLLTACGGGGDSQPAPQPEPEPQPEPQPEPLPEPPPEPVAPVPTLSAQHLSVMAGTPDLADRSCTVPEGSTPRPSRSLGWQQVRFHSIERFYSHGGHLYVIDDANAQRCLDNPVATGTHRLFGTYRMDARGLFEWVLLGLEGRQSPANLFFREEALYSLSLVRTNADHGFVWQGPEPTQYEHLQPYLSAYAWSWPDVVDLRAWPVAGYTSEYGHKPAVVDGLRNDARFHTPHGLVSGGDGLQYFVDNGRVRTIDGDFHVRTLDLPSLQTGEEPVDLDADPQGQVHLVAQAGGAGQSGVFSWHRLSGAGVGTGAGERRELRIEGFGTPHISMAVKDDVLWLAVRDDALPEKWSAIYRVAWDDLDAAGALRPIVAFGGAEIPATDADYLGQPTRYRLPNVRDVHFVGDALWISVGQAALAIEVD